MARLYGNAIPTIPAVFARYQIKKGLEFLQTLWHDKVL
jgi:hypothetical protein